MPAKSVLEFPEEIRLVSTLITLQEQIFVWVKALSNGFSTDLTQKQQYPSDIGPLS